MTTDSPTLSIHYAFLPRSDPDASLAFYRDVLGWEVLNDVGRGTMRWITVAPAGGGTALVLQPPTADPGVTEAEQGVVAAMMAKGTYAMLTLVTPELDADFERLASGGAEVVQEPTDQPYGVRDAAVRDPAGNLIRINQS